MNDDDLEETSGSSLKSPVTTVSSAGLNSTTWDPLQASRDDSAVLAPRTQGSSPVWSAPLRSAIQKASRPASSSHSSSKPPMDTTPYEDFSPPMNFAIVERGLFRSSFPTKKNFPYLKKLGLKTILTLVVEEYPAKNHEFMRESGIALIQIGLRSNKEPFVEVEEDKIEDAILKILDTRNHPMLIHCNKGKHRTGTLVGCVRKIQKWCLAAIFAEYIRYSNPKHRVMDQQFIELFNPRTVLKNVDRKYTPRWPGLVL